MELAGFSLAWVSFRGCGVPGSRGGLKGAQGGRMLPAVSPPISLTWLVHSE